MEDQTNMACRKECTLHRGHSRLFLAFICLLLAGCATSPQEKTVFYISLHTVVPEVEAYGRGVSYVKSYRTGESVAIRTVSLVNASSIARAEVLEVKGSSKFGLRLFLDAHGMSQFQEVRYHNTDRLAVVIDGFLEGVLTLSGNIRSEESMDLPPLWNREEAEAIAVHARKNYDILNRSANGNIL